MVSYVVAGAEGNLSARLHARQDDGVKWCRFGAETIFWRSADPGGSWPPDLRNIAIKPKKALGELYLVVQVGNSFLEEFPDSRVIVNKGRYLAVDLTSQEIARIHDHGHTCFGMKPLPECSAAITTLTPTRRERDLALATLVSGLSRASLTATLSQLAAFRTRHSLSAEFSAAADWMKSELEALGYTVSKTPISVGPGSSFNVVAERAGEGSNRKLVAALPVLTTMAADRPAWSRSPGSWPDSGIGMIFV